MNNNNNNNKKKKNDNNILSITEKLFYGNCNLIISILPSSQKETFAGNTTIYQ